MRLRSITKGRSTYFAIGDLAASEKGVRFCGELVECDHLGRVTDVVRESFDVKVAENGRFKVDIGTGSGVKVEFQS